MNIGGTKATNDILFLNFNQDYSCISVGTRNGYKMYNCDPFGKCYGKAEGGIGIVEMLFCTSLVALVGAGEHPSFSPRKLQLINTKRQSTICELMFPTSILSVKLNRKRLIIVLEDHIYIYDIGNMKLLHTIDTYPNPNALCALSPSAENCFLAYPYPPQNPTSTTGHLLIFDTISLQPITDIKAHKSPLSCIQYNFQGTLVATCSDKGTIIRVFSVPGGEKLYQFRRGSMPVRIYSISFNLVSTMLAISSDTDTVHIFKLSSVEERNQEREEKHNSIVSRVQNKVASVTQYITPQQVTEIFEPARDFAFAKIPVNSKGRPSICALTTNGAGLGTLMVVTADGFYFEYPIGVDGGECAHVQQRSLVDAEDAEISE